MENLFMQVFDRRDCVVGQMRQQVDSHAESLACVFLAAGHRPPPWLLPSCAAAPQELNGKPIVPGLLLAGSQMTTPATRRTVFQPPVAPSTSLGNVGVPNGYAGLETICDTVDANQHEVPQQKQVSIDQEIGEVSAGVNMSSVPQQKQVSVDQEIGEVSAGVNMSSVPQQKQVSVDREIGEVSAGVNMCSVPQQKQVSVDQEIAELSAGVHMFSVVKRSRSRQRHIEDRLREKVQATNSGTSDVMQDRMLWSELATAGSNRTTASLSSKPCGDGENNAGTTVVSLPGQEKDFCANQDRSTEFVKCSKDGDLGNQGVKLDCSQNQIVSSDNNVKVSNDGSVRSSLGVQVKGSVCHALPETYLSVEPKKLQFDGVELVCMNPASEKTVQQPVCALESANVDVADAHPLNEDPSSTSYSQDPHFLVGLLLDGVESGYLNPDTASVKQQQKCASLDLTGAHSGKEDQSLTSSPEVPNPTSIDTLHTVENAERITKLDSFSDPIITQSSESFDQQCSDSHAPHPPYSETLQSPTQLADTSSGDPASSQILPDNLLVEAGSEDLSHSPVNDVDNKFSQLRSVEFPEQLQPQTGLLVEAGSEALSHSPVNDVDNQCSQLRSAECPEQLQPQTGLLVEAGSEALSHSPVNGVDNQSSQLKSAECPEQLQPQTGPLCDAYRTSLSPSKTQSNDTHSNGCPVVNPSLSEENDLSQEQHFLARASLEFNVTDVETPLGPASPVTQHEVLEAKPAYDAVNISVSNKKDEPVVPNVMSSVSARRASEMYTAERNNMTSAEDLQQDGTEQDTSLPENAVKENANSCTAEIDKRKISQPSVQYFLHSAVSHEKINLLESDRRSAACDQKRSVQDGVKVKGSLSSKRRRIRSQSDFDLSRTPCANSLSLNHQVDIAGHMLTVTNFSEKSHPSDYYPLRSSGSCKSTSPEGENAASNCRISVASEIYGDGNSSRGRYTTSQLNDVLNNSPTASTSRSAMEARVFENSQEQIQNKLEVEFLTTAALHYGSGILSPNEENVTQQEGTCLEGQDLNVTTASVADKEMALEMDTLSPPIAILNQENYSGMEHHGEQASAPNALFHEELCDGSNIKLDRKYKSYDPKGHLLSGAGIARQSGDESFDCGNLMPVFQSFKIHDQFESPIVGKGPFEALYDPQQFGTFGSDPPNKYNTNTARSLHQLLTIESGKLRNRPLSDHLKQYSAGNSHSIMGSFGCELELDTFFVSDDVGSCSSNASIRHEISETPLTPSVEKYSQQLPSRSGSRSEQMGSIPELAIFRIDEDNSIPEEDEYQDRLPGSVDVNHSCQRSYGRTALQDITGLCQNNENSPSLSMRCMDKGNIDLSAESASGELTHHSNIRNGSIKRKYNHPTSVKRKGTASRSLHDRHRSEANVDKQGTAEPLSSRKGRHRSEANVDRQSKPSNIVANVTSFVPLVKQKLQSTTVCAKKDVKVKALKAAEAAKRLEEKKQKEQEQRKAAAKAERERLKQEKELKQKLEDEQKKKREVDAAAKKRQREEVEKRETMRKRKCTDESRKQQKQPMDRQRGSKAEKDARQKASDNMDTRNNFVDLGKNQVKSDGTTEHALRYKANESKDEKGVAVDDRNASFGSDAKENILNSLEESYAMSPYKDSDDEDDDDYDEHEQEARRRRKFVPSWARKEKLDNILLSNKALDPREIFAEKLSFNIPEVLSVHIPQRVLR